MCFSPEIGQWVNIAMFQNINILLGNMKLMVSFLSSERSLELLVLFS